MQSLAYKQMPNMFTQRLKLLSLPDMAKRTKNTFSAPVEAPNQTWLLGFLTPLAFWLSKRLSGGIQEAPKRHPGGTREAF